MTVLKSVKNTIWITVNSVRRYAASVKQFVKKWQGNSDRGNKYINKF